MVNGSLFNIALLSKKSYVLVILPSKYVMCFWILALVIAVMNENNARCAIILVDVGDKRKIVINTYPFCQRVDGQYEEKRRDRSHR